MPHLKPLPQGCNSIWGSFVSPLGGALSFSQAASASLLQRGGIEFPPFFQLDLFHVLGRMRPRWEHGELLDVPELWVILLAGQRAMLAHMDAATLPREHFHPLQTAPMGVGSKQFDSQVKSAFLSAHVAHVDTYQAFLVLVSIAPQKGEFQHTPLFHGTVFPKLRVPDSIYQDGHSWFPNLAASFSSLSRWGWRKGRDRFLWAVLHSGPQVSRHHDRWE